MTIIVNIIHFPKHSLQIVGHRAFSGRALALEKMMGLVAGRKQNVNSGEICPRVYSIKPFQLPWWQRAFDKASESAEGVSL